MSEYAYRSEHGPSWLDPRYAPPPVLPMLRGLLAASWSLTPEQVAADREARRVAARQQHAQAVAEWEAVRGSATVSAFPPALLLLDPHKPSPLDEHLPGAPVCDHCCDGGYDGARATWPCETFEIIRDGLGAAH